MATPSEITPIIEQAWNADPEQNFFELLADVFQTNENLYSLGEVTHDEVRAAFEAHISGVPSEGETPPDEAVTPTE